jgi:hypothetical protein
MLLEEFLKPSGLGQVEAARRLGINRLNEIVLGKRGITTPHYVGTPVQDVAAILDAAPGRLGSGSGDRTKGAKSVVITGANGAPLA